MPTFRLICRIISLIVLLAYSSLSLAQDSEHIGTIVRLDGNVEIFSNPSSSVQGQLPHALFEGLYYSIEKAHLGTKIFKGNIVRTGKDAKACIHFPNGDQYNIGPSTAYKISWEAKSEAQNEKASASIVGLMYGKIRGIVSKKGPRSGLEIQTNLSSIGVRGTDFYISHRPVGGTQLSVIRGEVAMTPKADAGLDARPILVPKGVSAELTKDTPMIEMSKTSQQELLAIQKASVVAKPTEEIKKLDTNVAKEIEKLEVKAVENTLSDIKDYDPALYEKIQKKKMDSAVAINTAVISEEFKNAPKKPSKPGMKDLENLEDNVYEKYFHSIE